MIPSYRGVWEGSQLCRKRGALLGGSGPLHEGVRGEAVVGSLEAVRLEELVVGRRDWAAHFPMFPRGGQMGGAVPSSGTAPLLGSSETD